MLRQIIRKFENLVVHHTLTKNVKLNLLSTQQFQQRRLFFHRNESLTAATNSTPHSGEADNEYIVPYSLETESKSSANAIIEALRTRFRLNAEDVNHIMSDDIVNRAHRAGSLVNTLELLSLKGVTKHSFIQYPWLLTLEKVRLKEKLDFILSMNIRDVNDFVPFLRLSVQRLTKLVSGLNKEAKNIPHGNRVYYISEKLDLEASLVTKYLAKRLFILEMPFEMLEQNLKYMIDYEVSPMNILKDLWAFRYTPKAVHLRLERAKRAKKDKIMPWMVRCTEPILQRSLKLSLDELKVLNGKPSTVEYLAERLNFTVEEARAIMDKHPVVHRVRVTKIKEVLDYLLNEADFQSFDIAQVPRILCHSLQTTKERYEELQKMGCRPSSLVILCRSKREYEKFKQEWLERQKKYSRNSKNENTEEFNS